MSAMTASERARADIEELIVAAYAEGGARKMLRLALDEQSRTALRDKAERHNAEKRDAQAALLAYLAALEACVAAAREAVASIDAGEGFGGDGLDADGERLKAALAALDAPATEDGR